MLERAGVDWFSKHAREQDEPGSQIVVVEAKPYDLDSKNLGYSEFAAEFCFGPDGTLAWIGIWE